MFLFAYVMLVTIYSFIIMGIDKWKAVHRKRRVSEKSLMLLTCIGGFAGIFAAMIVFRHKTKKPKFTVLVPLIGLIETTMLFFITDLITKIGDW